MGLQRPVHPDRAGPAAADPGADQRDGHPGSSLAARGSGAALPQGSLAGKPVITYDIDGAKEGVIDETSGFVLPPFDKDKLSDAMAVLLDDPGLRRSMGEAGRRFALARFDDRVMVEALEEVYRYAGAKVRTGPQLPWEIERTMPANSRRSTPRGMRRCSWIARDQHLAGADRQAPLPPVLPAKPAITGMAQQLETDLAALLQQRADASPAAHPGRSANRPAPDLPAGCW